MLYGRVRGDVKKSGGFRWYMPLPLFVSLLFDREAIKTGKKQLNFLIYVFCPVLYYEG